ncbi:DNA polymerase I, partial [bacterium]|nr:DNA polymerase I [bacterium]
GVTIDTAILDDLRKDFRRKLEEVATRIYQTARCSFNIGSTKQVAEILFNKIGLKTGRKTKTGLSTGSEVLEELVNDHPLPGMILEYRHLDKMLSTYVEALPGMVHPETGRVHTSFNQFIAATGRLSSSNPNLQNIPIRSPLGRDIRKAFLPNPPHDLFLAADYSQVELRVLAHLSKDVALQDAFVHNKDIHAETAARIFDMPLEMVTGDMRAQAKVINFGILYGMGAHRLSRELGISHAQAKKFIEEYFQVYPGVKQWMDQTLEQARETGMVSTLSGRRRIIPNLNTRNFNARSNAERMAINTPVQGAAADMIKIAMIVLDTEIQNSDLEARMVLQVHDELVLSLPESEINIVRPLVEKCMVSAMPLDVPLQVDIKVGRTWAQC